MGILSVLLWTPAAGALIITSIPGHHLRPIRWLANLSGVAAFAVSCVVLGRFDETNPGSQFAEYAVLNPKLGSAYALGVDGLSAPLLAIATLLTAVAIFASAKLTDWIKGYFICILALEFGLLGVFLAQDWSIFYIFWELTLTPLFFLIDRWGGKRRHAASLNFVLYTMGGSIFMLLSMIAIYQHVPGQGTLMTDMAIAAQHMPKHQQVLAFLGFLIGFGVKLPVFPLHGWLPLAHVEAPSPISVLLSGILLKMGSYGLIRVITMMPDAAQTLQPVLVFLALFGMIYGGLLAWRQTDLKAMVAYSSVSHMGIVLLGIAVLNETGLQGAVLQMTAHGLIAGSMFLLVGLLYERTHTRNIADYSSLIYAMPKFAILMTLTLFAAMGLPGTAGFIAELHTLLGGFQALGWLMVFFSLSLLISAAYAVRTITLLFTGPVRTHLQHVPDLQTYELAAASLLISGILLTGFYPAPLLELSAATIAQIYNPVRGGL